MRMNKALQSLKNLLIGLLIIIGVLYWAFSPSQINISDFEIEKELEKTLGFNLPSDFIVINARDNGYSPGDLYYTYEIQYEQDSFDKFMKEWSKFNKDLSWKSGNPKTGLLIQVFVQPENRMISYYYAED